jgi:hypothetical protein
MLEKALDKAMASTLLFLISERGRRRAYVCRQRQTPN